MAVARPAQGALLGSIFGWPWGAQVDFWIALGAQEGAKTDPEDDPKAILKSMLKTLACYNGLKTDLGRSWADLGAILGPGGSKSKKKWLWLESGALFQKKVAVARELGMGNHHSRATATFF